MKINTPNAAAPKKVGTTPAWCAVNPQITPPRAVAACETMTIVAFMRPLAQPGIARWLATQSSEAERVHPMPPSAATTKNANGRWTKTIRQLVNSNRRLAKVVMRCGEYLARAHGMMKEPLMTEPTAIAVKRYPSSEA